MKPTIDTYFVDGTPSRSRAERTREEFARDNKPTGEAINNGLAFVKPMSPSAYKPYREEVQK